MTVSWLALCSIALCSLHVDCFAVPYRLIDGMDQDGV